MEERPSTSQEKAVRASPVSLLPSGEELAELGQNEAERYRSAKPFPHIVIDDLFDPAVLDQVLEEFPAPDHPAWQRWKLPTEIKLDLYDDAAFGPTTWRLLQELNSPRFLVFLEKLSGIPRLLADPYFEGGGLHQIEPGGKLEIHVDFNKHRRLQLDRRLNVLIYLNRDWQDAWGGHLELWDPDMQRCVARNAPLFNRMIVFTTTSSSYHGHPDPLTCPRGRTRKSLALYYYTAPVDDATMERHTTVFRRRPGDPLRLPSEVQLRHLLNRVTPPILMDLARAARKRFSGVR